MNELQTIEGGVIGQRALFDYAALGVEDSVIVQQRTSEIKSLAKRVASDIVEIGGKLVEVRDRLKNGKFKEWLDAEFPDWSQRTAYNFIAVWEKYSAADFAIDGIAPSALYLLAAPSTPTSARQMAKQLVQAGHGVSHSTAKEIVRKAKERRPKQIKMIEDLKEAEKLEEAEEGDVDDAPSTAIQVYVGQAELDEMDRVNACDKIDKGVPVEFYDYEGEQIVITSSLSSGAEGVISACGWRIVSEKDAQGVTKPERDELETQSYIGDRVNVGGKSRPNWWVIVGPEYEFERMPAGEKTLAIPMAPKAEKSEPQELPAGWTWAHRDARVPSYGAENLERNLRTLTLRTEAEVIRATHEIEAGGREGLLGLTGQGLVSQVTAPHHHVMPPDFSETDDKDETGFRLYGVIGDLDQAPKIRLRVGVYGYHYEIPASWALEVPHGLMDCNSDLPTESIYIDEELKRVRVQEEVDEWS
jgi:hypothetical protein